MPIYIKYSYVSIVCFYPRGFIDITQTDKERKRGARKGVWMVK